MTVKLLFFASLRERAGCPSMQWPIAEGLTAGALLEELRRDLPAMSAAGRISVAVNEEYVGGDHLLADGDEIALIPPVSGGIGPAAHILRP
jgi:molybdopterin converting factor subunit 1